MRNYNLPHFIIYLFVITATICSAQKSISKEAAYQYLPDYLELYNTIVSMDSSFFQAYNNCDLDKQAAIYSDDIEFYHDKGGIMTVKQEILNNTEKYVCGKVTRELVEGSIEIYPIKDFGAIEIGLHKFHNNTEKEDTVSHASKGSSLNVVGKYINSDFCIYKIYLNARFL